MGLSEVTNKLKKKKEQQVITPVRAQNSNGKIANEFKSFMAQMQNNINVATKNSLEELKQRKSQTSSETQKNIIPVSSNINNKNIGLTSNNTIAPINQNVSLSEKDINELKKKYNVSDNITEEEKEESQEKIDSVMKNIAKNKVDPSEPQIAKEFTKEDEKASNELKKKLGQTDFQKTAIYKNLLAPIVKSGEDIGTLGSSVIHSIPLSLENIAHGLGKFESAYEKENMGGLRQRNAINRALGKEELSTPNLVNNALESTRIEDNRKWQEEKIQQNSEKMNTKLGTWINEQIPSISQNLVGMAVSAINPILGSSTFAASAFGGYYDDAIASGLTEKQAYSKAGLMSTFEFVSESVVTANTVDKVKGLASRLAGKTTEEAIKKEAESVFKDIAIDAGENFLQEAVMDPLEVMTEKYVKQEKLKASDIFNKEVLSQAFKDGVAGAFSSVLLFGIGAGLGSAENIVNKITSGEKIKTEDINKLDKEAKKAGLNLKETVKQSSESVIDGLFNRILNNKEQLEQRKENNTTNNISIDNEENIVENIRTDATDVKNNLIEKLNSRIPIQQTNIENNTNMSPVAETTRSTAIKYKEYFTSEAEMNKVINSFEKLQNIRNKFNKNGTLTVLFDDSINGNGVMITDKEGNRTIKINPKTDKAAEFVLVHELTHDLKNTATYNELENLVKSFNNKQFNYEEALQSIKNTYEDFYNRNNLDVSTLDIYEEAMADILGIALGNQEFVNQLAQKPTVFQRLKNWINKQIDIHKSNDKELTKWLYNVQDTFKKAIRDKVKGTSTNGKSIQEIKKYSIAGTKAISNIRYTASALYNEAVSNYEKALKLIKENVSNEKVIEETGWYKDKNGDIKFEFSDKDMSLKQQKYEVGKQYKLKDILKHDTLFFFYPELMNYNVEFVKYKEKNSNASFNRKTKKIELSSELINKKINAEGTLLHEIQHAIQQLENFEGGASLKNGEEKYYNSLGEIEAADTKRRFLDEKYNNFNRNSKMPESAHLFPIHPDLTKNNAESIIKKMNDSFKDYLNEKNLGDKSYEIYNQKNKENLLENNRQNGIQKVERKSININQELEKSSSFSLQERKEKQLDIINKTNPADDDIHTWIRSTDDIKTFEEAFFEDGEYSGMDPDFDENMAQEALDSGKITVYSSYPIENGTFVSPSIMEAEQYAGGDSSKLYSKEVNIDDVAWIDGAEGQYAKVDNNLRYSQEGKEKWKEYLDFIDSKVTETIGKQEKTYFKNQEKLVEKQLTPVEEVIKETNNTIKELQKEVQDLKENIAPVNKNSLDSLVEDLDKQERTIAPINGKAETGNTLQEQFENLTNSKIRTDRKKKKSFKDVKSEVKQTSKNLYQSLVNKMQPIEDLGKKTGNKELKFLAQKTLTASGQGQYNVGVAQTDISGKIIGKSVNDIFQQVIDNGKIELASEYLNLLDNSTRAERGRPIYAEINAEESKKLADDILKENPEFKELQKAVEKYQDNELKMIVEAGFINKADAKYIKEQNPYHVPIERIVDEKLLAPTKTITSGKGIKRAIGGNSDILSSKESIANRTMKLRRKIALNELITEMAKVKGKYQGIANPSTQYKTELLTKSNISEEDLQFVLDADMDVGTIFEQENDSVRISEDGKYKAVYFEDGIGHEFDITKGEYEALKQHEANAVEEFATKTLGKVSQFHKDMLTKYSLTFTMKNALKDIQDVAINTTSLKGFIKAYPKAMMQMAKDGELWNMYLANGGGNLSYFDYNTGVQETKTKNPVKIVGRAIGDVNEIVEQLPRFTEFISTLDRGGSIDEAMYNAADITTNFARGGEITKALNRSGATFLNASVQGFDKFIRNFSMQNGVRPFVATLAKAAAFGIAPALLNALIYGDDEDYDRLPDSDKDLYYLFKNDDGTFIRIPKGRTLSVFGTAARRTLNYSKGDKDAFKGMLETVSNQVAPNNPITDNVIAPIVAAATNKNWYGSQIVSDKLQEQLPKNQYDESTDDLSIAIGKKINVSPKKINYVIDQYSGGVGDILLPVMTKKASNKGNVFKDQFTTDSVLKNRYVSKFYDTIDKMTQITNDEASTEDDQLKLMYLNEVKSDVGELYNQKREIQNSNLSNKEKSKQVREVQKQINDKIEDALKNYERINKSNENIARIKDSTYVKLKGDWKAISDSDAEKIQKIEESGATADDYLKYKIATYHTSDEDMDSKEKSLEKLNYIKNVPTDKIRTALYENTVGESDNNFRDYKGSSKAYIQYKIDTKEATEDGKSLKQNEKIDILLNNGYKESDIKKLYESQIKSDEDLIYDSLKDTIDIKEYLKYKQQDFSADKEDDGTLKGKTVTGSAKEKVYTYINNMNISYEEKLILIGAKYKLNDEERSKLARYINTLSLNKKNKLELYSKMKGFTVYKDGRVTW